MNLKAVKKQWWAVWSKDGHAGAACALCNKVRHQTDRLIEGISGYVCDACVFQSVGVLSTSGGDGTGASAAASSALGAVLAALPERAPHSSVEPLVEAMLLLAREPADAETIFSHAAARGHEVLAHRALASVPEAKRLPRIAMNLAATCINLERFDEAARAVEAARKTADAGEALFLDCHEAVLAAHTGRVVQDAELEALLARTRRAANDALVCEALEATARHRAARGELAAALSAVDEALALHRSSALLLLRGDLFSDADLPAAREAWQTALELAHPDGIYASRARERLALPHPYRAR